MSIRMAYLISLICACIGLLLHQWPLLATATVINAFVGVIKDE